MRFDLTLPYDLAEGWYAPWLAGLRKGKAVAAQCNACGSVSFPPLRTCSCGGRDNDWITLDGTAGIVWRCNGTDGAFALVRFDGADTRAVVRLQGIGADVTKGRLVPAVGERPAVLLGPMERQRDDSI
jgi:uncharacterized protein